METNYATKEDLQKLTDLLNKSIINLNTNIINSSDNLSINILNNANILLSQQNLIVKSIQALETSELVTPED